MSKVYILEADPTRFGGIQQFCRNLGEYLPEKAVLLAYYGDLAYDKQLPCPLVRLNRSKIFKGAYLSLSSWLRNIALLLDIPKIRYNLAKQLHPGDTLVLNSASAMLFFCNRKVLKNQIKEQTLMVRDFAFLSFMPFEFIRRVLHVLKRLTVR